MSVGTRDVSDASEMESSSRVSAVREKAAGAMKWSFVAQLVNKLVSPLTQIVLAHILAPEAFGVVATITMVTTFLRPCLMLDFRST